MQSVRDYVSFTTDANPVWTKAPSLPVPNLNKRGFLKASYGYYQKSSALTCHTFTFNTGFK